MTTLLITGDQLVPGVRVWYEGNDTLPRETDTILRRCPSLNFKYFFNRLRGHNLKDTLDIPQSNAKINAK